MPRMAMIDGAAKEHDSSSFSNIDGVAQRLTAQWQSAGPPLALAGWFSSLAICAFVVRSFQLVIL